MAGDTKFKFKPLYYQLCSKDREIATAIGFPAAIAGIKMRSKRTAASCSCARLRAHKRKYDAVWDTAPSTNSMVAMA